VAFVAGNHDDPYVDAPEGCVDVDGFTANVAGWRVGGVGGAGPARFGFPYEWSEDEIRKRPPLDAQILLVHCPPIRTRLARCNHGGDAGSAAIRERLVPGVRVLLCGHIHESAGFEVVDGVPCMNAGSLGRPWGAPQVATLEIDAQRVVLRHQRFVESEDFKSLSEGPTQEAVFPA